MSLDVSLIETRPVEVYSRNITHNLTGMALEAGIYQHLWRPEEIEIEFAHQLILPLTRGLELLLSDPTRFEAFNAPNGWGTYKDFVGFVEDYLMACEEFPNALIDISR